MMAKVEASINPNTILGDGYIFLRIDRPLARRRDLFVKRRDVHWEKTARVVQDKRELSGRKGKPIAK